MIPKIFHFIWVGDETQRPDNCIQTWRDHHPDWEFRIWGNAELMSRPWANHAHIEAMLQRELNGVADMMRWEILHEHGGVVFDADSVCARPLDDHLLDCDAFACWENEIVRPGLIAAGYFGCEAGNPFVRAIIEDIAASPSVVEEMAWKTVGPQRLTDCYRKFGYSKLRIYPSHYFIPKHFTGQEYDGDGPVYAYQLWGSTLKTYDEIYKAEFDAPREAAPPPEPKPETTVTVSSAPAAEPAPVAAATATVCGASASVDAATVTLAAPRAQEAPKAPAIATAPGHSPLEALHDPYLIQRVEVSSELAGLGRLEVFASLCAGKRVLHVGCAGTDARAALHRQLEPLCAALDGYDPDGEALAFLRAQVGGSLFDDFAAIAGSYDLVLVPEVMDQVSDVADFLARLEAVDAGCFIVAVADAFQCRAQRFDFIEETGTFVEVVHPDHRAWYTPYTFANTIRQHSGLNLERLWFFDETAILGLLSKPALALAA